jgi:hypothetical protein
VELEIHHKHGHERPPRPKNWKTFRAGIRYRWTFPFFFIDWLAEWASYGLSRLSILKFLEYCGSFSILIAVIFYFLDGPERTKMKHYQAWQVINTSQGQSGSGGRIEALHELNEDHVSLIGVNVADAFLQGVRLEKAKLSRANLTGTDLRQAVLSGADLQLADLTSANLRGARLDEVNLDQAVLRNADLTGADLHGADLAGADLSGADLTDIVDWKSIGDLSKTNIHGVENAPEGFVAFARSEGAVDIGPKN